MADPSTILRQIAAAGTIDTAKLLASKAVTPQFRQLVSGSGVKMPPTIKYDMWIDAENLPVKFDYGENITVGRKVTKFAVDMTYTDWGRQVDIQPPPADQVGSLPAH